MRLYLSTLDKAAGLAGADVLGSKVLQDILRLLKWRAGSAALLDQAAEQIEEAVGREQLHLAFPALGTSSFKQLMQAATCCQRSYPPDIRVVSAHKLALDVDRCAGPVYALYIAHFYPEIEYVEPQTVMAPRGHATTRLVTTGPSDESFRALTLPLSEAGINGTREVIGVVDTGADTKHCMLSQDAFPFPCYNRDSPLQDGTKIDPMCSGSRFTNLLTSADFREMVTVFSSSWADRRLLESGSTLGVPSFRPPLDHELEALGMDRTQRHQQGHALQLGDRRRRDSLLPLLDTFADVLPALHAMLVGGRAEIDNATNTSICSRCGFEERKAEGLAFVLPDYEDYEYDALEDSAGELFAEAAGDSYTHLQRRMFQQCFCVMASAANPRQQHIKNSASNTWSENLYGRIERKGTNFRSIVLQSSAPCRPSARSSVFPTPWQPKRAARTAAPSFPARFCTSCVK